MSATHTTGSRSRPQARRKVADDASYFGPSGGGGAAAAAPVGTKRQAVERAEGDNHRAKRKRVEPVLVATMSMDGEPKRSLVDFKKFPTPVLHRYLTQFDLIPPIYPSPLSADDPPPPSSLANPAVMRQPPSPRSQSRRRSSRLVDEEFTTRVPILADIDELHGVLARIAERHFQTMSISGREEVDTLASFMCAIEKSKGLRTLKC